MATLFTSPIWKDTYYTTTADTAYYNITCDGNNIFSGKAVRYPGAETIKININKVCHNYLNSDITELIESMPTSPESVEQPNAQRVFKLYVGGGNVADYRFYEDWSYTNEKSSSGQVSISAPINGHFTPTMLKLRSVRNSSTSVSNVYTYGVVGENNWTYYHTLTKCHPYALYYKNSYGGWDSFLIEGAVKRTDNYTSYKTDQAYDNTTLEFETNKYVNEIKTSYELNTHQLNDEESANLAKNLIGSTKVYLHNMDEGWVKPVIIDNNSIKYQTYSTNGRKLSQYTINVTESQSKVRL